MRRHFLTPLPPLRAIVALLWLLVPALGAATPTRLHALDIHYRQDGATLELRLTEPVSTTQVSSFTLTDPARLVLDLSEVEPVASLPRQMTASGLLKRVSLAHDGQRLRLLVQLKQPLTHRLHAEGDRLLVDLAPREATTAAAIQAIEFSRGPAGEGRLALTLGSPDHPVQVRRSGQRLRIDIGGAQLPPSLPRHSDVTAFGTPVQAYSAQPHAEGVRLFIEAQGHWRHHAYQRGRQLLIEIVPGGPEAALAGAGKEAGKDYSGKRLSLNFQNIEVRTALQVLADFTGLNIVASDSVAGQLSLRLKDLPWDQALDMILQARGLQMRRQGEVLWIAPREEILARERQQLEQQAQIADLEPLQAESFQLNYQRADTLRRALGIGEDGSSQPGRRPTLLSRRGSAMIDSHTNQLLVTDTIASLANVRKLIERIDVAARQVLIEARIVEADDSFGRHLGARMGMAVRTRGAALGNGYPHVAELSGQSAAAAEQPPRDPAVDLRADKLAGHVPGSFAFTLFNAAAQRFLNIELSALEADGRGTIVSSPRLITADQQPALIEQGEEIPYQQSAGNGVTATAFKKANLKLEVTPQITPDGNVILDVDLNKDSRGSATPGGLAINTKHVKTKVQVEDGGTVVIGGIYTQTDHTQESRVPLLGEIPLLGALFRHSASRREKTELLIFLTPRIVAAPRPY